MTLEKIRLALLSEKEPDYIKTQHRFFKMAVGDYGHGDIFLGIRMPKIRKIARLHAQTAPLLLANLLKSKFHEERALALVILVNRYKKSAPSDQKEIFDFYIDHLDGVNNWDLVDLSSPAICGHFFYTHMADKGRKMGQSLASSPNLWHRRVAILSTFYAIRAKDYELFLLLAKDLINDRADLIQKAVGWMLREVGKESEGVAFDFLEAHAPQMPRTMVRYAVEKYPEKRRRYYMEKS